MPTTTRARRLRSRRIRRWTGTTGVVVGLVLLGSVAWQLWGTGLRTAHAQAIFRRQFTVHGFPSRPVPGGAVGFIRIPKLGLDMAFVQGVDAGALAKGPGHYPGTPLPGQGGNVAIAGHRTTHLHPFWSLPGLLKGDEVILQTRAGTFDYHVLWVRGVAADDWSVIAPTAEPALTLTTCNPLFHSTERLVVRAVLADARMAGPHGVSVSLL